MCFEICHLPTTDMLCDTGANTGNKWERRTTKKTMKEELRRRRRKKNYEEDEEDSNKKTLTRNNLSTWCDICITSAANSEMLILIGMISKAAQQSHTCFTNKVSRTGFLHNLVNKKKLQIYIYIYMYYFLIMPFNVLRMIIMDITHVIPVN